MSIRFAVEVDALGGVLSGEADIALFRIVQEGVNNILKHSQATEAEIRITRDAHTLRAVIKDNGRGFDLQRVRSDRDHGFGLSGISERVRLLGGTERIESAPGRGTTITIDLGIERELER